MRRLPRFRSLRGRLTLSYVLVTVIALLTLEGAALLLIGLTVAQRTISPPGLAANLARATPQFAPFLLDPTNEADLHGLSAWLNGGGLVPVSGGGVVTEVAVGQQATLLITDAHGTTLTSWSSGQRDLAPSSVERYPETRALIAAVVAGQTDYRRLYATTRTGLVIAAAPVVLDGKLLGVLAVATNLQEARTFFLTAIFQALLPSAIVLTILATIIGTLFGIVIARGLTRRLGALTSAAAAWSEGDFSAVARDRSGDEVGRLAGDLNRMAGQLRALLQDRQQLAVVEERNRLARDLHDAVKQQVFATSMQIAAARNLLASDAAAAETRLAEAQRLVGEAQRELTSLILELRPAALEGKGLTAALREYCADWARQTGIEADFRAQGERPAPLPLEEALFRVAQEALSNVARHSGATAAEVQLSWAGTSLLLAVRDNGHGFDAAAARGAGVGLGSMRERVAALGGTVEIESPTPRGGTRVEARVPLPDERPAGIDKADAHADVTREAIREGGA